MSRKDKVLIIEDDEHINLLIAENLKSENYEVFSAYDGLEGLEAARRHMPDLILLDLLLPKMNGWEVYQNLRQPQSPLRKTPVIIVSILSKEAKLPSQGMGSLTVMAKPFDVKILLSEVKRVVDESAD
jgi:DNA-binding response OmpR family regulator